MIDTEAGRDPLDVAADEAANIMVARKEMGVSWPVLVAELQKGAEAAQRRFLLAQRLQSLFAAGGGQLPLIPDAVAEPKRKRAKSRRMMHEGPLPDTFECPKCRATAPVGDLTAAARKRGVPCPKCNAPAEK